MQGICNQARLDNKKHQKNFNIKKSYLSVKIEVFPF